MEKRLVRLFLYACCSLGLLLCLITTLMVTRAIPVSRLLDMDEGENIVVTLCTLYGVTGVFILFSRYYINRLDIIGIDVRDNLMYCRNAFRSITGPVGSISEVRFTQRRRLNVLRIQWHYQSIKIGGTLCEEGQTIPYQTLRQSPEAGLERLVVGLRIHTIPVSAE